MQVARRESSLRMEAVIERLRPLSGAADLRDERQSLEQDFKIGETVEVAESSYAEFDRLEQSWVGTTPSGLPRPERDTKQPRQLRAWGRAEGRPCRRR